MTVSNIAADIQQPNMVGMAGNIVNLANAGQQFQQQQVQTQVIQQANRERQNVMQLMQSDPKAKPGPDGTFDTAYLSQVLPQIAPQTWAEQLQRIGTTNQNVLKANSDQMNYNANQQTDIANILKDNYNKDISDVSNNLQDAQEKFPMLAARIGMINHQLNQIPDKTDHNAINAILAHNVGITQTLQQQLELQKGQKELQTPTGVDVSTGQVSKKVSISPAWATGIPVGGTIPGTEAQQVVPPTAPTMVNGKPSYVGPQPVQAPRSIAAGPALGQAELAQGGAQVVNNHYGQLQSDAAGAAQFEGIARNIQNLAPKAITGTGEDRLNLLNGILAQMGLGKADDVKSASDLIQKNMAMLNMTGQPGTDMKMLVTQMAQPHISMTPEAIKEATNQLIGQVRMRKDLANYFTPDMNYAKATGDTGPYMSKLSTVNPLTDARAWQFGAMSKEDQRKFRAGLSPEDDAALGQKIKSLHALGLLQ